MSLRLGTSKQCGQVPFSEVPPIVLMLCYALLLLLLLVRLERRKWVDTR